MVDGRKRNSIKRFEDLEVWQDAQSLAVSIYKLTKTFPKDEQFALTSQIRRSSSSISANIAEGFGRRTNGDKVHFYHIAYGSLLETKNFIYLSHKLGYISDSDKNEKIEFIEHVQKLINGVLRYFKVND